MRATLFILASLFLLSPLHAQDAAPPLRVYLDCQNEAMFTCDFDYFRTEITFVDYVRNREDSDVHAIVTAQENGSGGDTFTLRFIGLKKFAGVEDELQTVTSQTNTQDEKRAALAQTLRAGLVRYLARTDALARLTLTYAAPTGVQAATPERDPWNYWTFRANVRGFFNGEASYESLDLNGSFQAQRTTDTWKSESRVYYSFDRNVYNYDESTTTDLRRSYGVNTLLVRSLSPHVSAGGRASLFSSDYSNTDRQGRLAPAVEYSVFPYSEDTRRALRLLYTLGVSLIDYQEETIYFKTSETLFDHSLEASVAYQQPWGTVNVSLEGTQYLHDVSRYRLELGGGVNVRLARGLSMQVSGNVQRIQDQLSLRRGGASSEDVLLRRRELETGFRYFGSVGLSYTFGSIFNNVVNPRFESGGGIFFF